MVEIGGLKILFYISTAYIAAYFITKAIRYFYIRKSGTTMQDKKDSDLENHLLKAPMPGIIEKIPVSVGTAVKKGDVIMSMEALKMEIDIIAPQNGVITDIKVSAGKRVLTDDILAILN